MIKAPKLDHLPRQMGEMASWYSKDRIGYNIKNEKEELKQFGKNGHSLQPHCWEVVLQALGFDRKEPRKQGPSV